MVGLKFYCESGDSTYIEVSAYDKSNSIYIELNDDDNYSLGSLLLDKATAIKLSKELRKQIALLHDEESI
jgi:hypothetical protein